MRPCRVAIVSLVFNNLSSMTDTAKQALVHAFIAHAAIKNFDEAILYGLPGCSITTASEQGILSLCGRNLIGKNRAR